MPRPDHFRFRQVSVFGAELFSRRRPQIPDRPGRKQERKRVERERPFVADADHRRAQKCSNRQVGPLRRLGQRIRGMNFLFIRDGRQNRGSPGREKWRGHHQQRAERIEQPHLMLPQRQDESQRHHGAHQVARNHDALAVKPVEQHARQRADGDRGNRARRASRP